MRSTLGEHSIKNYATKKAPGSTLENPAVIDYLKNPDYFMAIDIKPFKIEYLKLEEPNHVRVRFSKQAAKWQGEFLVP